MAKCIFCLIETELYSRGSAVCKNCTEHSDTIRNLLIDEVLACTARNNEALRAFNVILGEVPSGLPNSDGSQRIHNASRRLEATRRGMMLAHMRLNDFLVRGIVPDDLKQGKR